MDDGPQPHPPPPRARGGPPARPEARPLVRRQPRPESIPAFPTFPTKHRLSPSDSSETLETRWFRPREASAMELTATGGRTERDPRTMPVTGSGFRVPDSIPRRIDWTA